MLINRQLPPKGVLFVLRDLFTIVVGPVVVGVIIHLIERWLDALDDD